MKETILEELNKIKEELWDISDYIYNNPEPGNKEFKAVEKLTSFLKKNNFEVEMESLINLQLLKRAIKAAKKALT